jgi:5-methylcytosine-specific restriction protein A
MKYWIVPCNDHIFRIGDAMNANDGLVDWRMSNNFSVGDMVFVYKAKPEQRIRYKMEIVNIGLNVDEALEQEPFWTDKETYYSGLGSYHYARFKFIEEFVDDIFSIHHLHEHGLKGNVQSVMQCKSEELYDFLSSPYKLVNDDVYDVDYPEDDERLYEGALIKVMANKYERNQKARKQCVETKGYKCLVCGCDFGAIYGEVGKGFIHVHHVVPISSIGKEYQLNVDTDLVPVCPNCHYMMHRKDPPYTVEEMREIMKPQVSTMHYNQSEEAETSLAADS